MMKYFENFFLEGQVCSNERPFLSNRGYLIIALRIMGGGGIETKSWYSDNFAQALCISRNCFSCELWGPSSWVSCENAFSFLTRISTIICFYSDIMFYGIDLFCVSWHSDTEQNYYMIVRIISMNGI